MGIVEEIVDFISVSVYDTENAASNGGVSMTSKEAIIAGLKATGDHAGRSGHQARLVGAATERPAYTELHEG